MFFYNIKLLQRLKGKIRLQIDPFSPSGTVRIPKQSDPTYVNDGELDELVDGGLDGVELERLRLKVPEHQTALRQDREKIQHFLNKQTNITTVLRQTFIFYGISSKKSGLKPTINK